METHPVSSYVLMTDIVKYSMVDQATQVAWVRRLFSLLRAALASTPLERPNVYPTGDGVILTFHLPGAPDSQSAAIPIELALRLLQLNSGGPFALRVSINFSPSETVLQLPGGPPVGDISVEAGEGIFLAERAMHFSEPNEVVVTEGYWDLLRVSGLLGPLRFEPLRHVFVKHYRPMDLFLYVPKEGEAGYVSSPVTGSTSLRRYAYFPPLLPETVARFQALDLGYEVEQLCRYTYDSVAVVNSKSTFVSWSKVYDILKRLNAINSEGAPVLVISRSDRSPNFWSTPAAERYLAHLRSTSRKQQFHQVRIFVYDQVDKEVASPEVLTALRDLHAQGTLGKIDRAYLGGNILSKYTFGVTIYPELGCAVSPIPAARSYDDYLQTVAFSSVHGAFLPHSDTKEDPGTFRGYVTAAADTVGALADAFSLLRRHPGLEEL
jgi:hypothetical protein